MNPERRRLAQEFCEIVREEIGWPNGNFIPDDPFRLVLFNVHCDGSMADDFEVETALMRTEELFGFEMTEKALDDLFDLTLGEALDVMLGVRVVTSPFPATGPDAPEARPCPRLAVFLDIRRYLSGPMAGVPPREIRPSAPVRDVVPFNALQDLHGYVRRRFGVRAPVCRDMQEAFLFALISAGAGLVTGAMAFLGLALTVRFEEVPGVGRILFYGVGLPSGFATMLTIAFAFAALTNLSRTLLDACIEVTRSVLRLNRPRIVTFADLVQRIVSERAKHASFIRASK